YTFTWAHKSASKMSKLDRYLISEGVLDLFSQLSALCLDRHLSDHRPILLLETNYDYGPSPFCVLRCFYLASGLKINLHKSKLMRIGVSSNVVATAASLIGCSILTGPFNYLGVRLVATCQELPHGTMLSLRMPRGGVEQENYGLLCSKVVDLVLSNKSDRWCWYLEGSQEFSVKCSRILIDNTILPKAEFPTRWLIVFSIKVMFACVAIIVLIKFLMVFYIAQSRAFGSVEIRHIFSFLVLFLGFVSEACFGSSAAEGVLFVAVRCSLHWVFASQRRLMIVVSCSVILVLSGFSKAYLITHLHDRHRHCKGEALAITKHSLLTDLVVFERAEGIPGGSLQLVRETLVESSSHMFDVDDEDLDLSERNLKQCRRKICDGYYTAAVRVLFSSGIAPYNDAILQELKAKHPFKSASSLPDTPNDHHHLIASQTVVQDRIKSFPRGTSCRQDGLHAQHLMDYLSGAAVAVSDDQWCIRPIAVGTVWRRLVSKVSATMVGHSLDGYLDDLQFGVGVSGGGEAILHAVNRLFEDRGDDVGLSMLLVDFQNAFNLVDRKLILQRTHPMIMPRGATKDPLGPLLFSLVLHSFCKIRDSFSLSLQAWYLDDGTIVGDTLVVGKALELIVKDGPRCGLYLNVDKTEIFRPRKTPEAEFDLVMKRVSKTIVLMDAVAKIFNVSCCFFGPVRISRLYFAMRTCPPRVFESAQRSFDSAALQTKLLRHVGIVAYGSTFDDASSVFNTSMEIDHLSNPTYSKFFAGDTYGDHAVSRADIIGIKHMHNVVRDTLVDICFRSRILPDKEVDIGLGGGCDKALRLADILLYSWDRGLDVYMDLTGSSPLTRTGMTDFVPGRAVTEAAQCKRVKYKAKCANIGYGFLPFWFSSFGDLEKDAVTLLKRIRKFSMAQDIGARVAVHIFNSISFSIAKGVGLK
nr:hypothetical protein [Tanacetum cinerariifolium]